jgi:hypothetical protein
LVFFALSLSERHGKHNNNIPAGFIHALALEINKKREKGERDCILPVISPRG